MIDYKEIDEAMAPIIERIREMNDAIVEAFNKAFGDKASELAALQSELDGAIALLPDSMEFSFKEQVHAFAEIVRLAQAVPVDLRRNFNIVLYMAMQRIHEQCELENEELDDCDDSEDEDSEDSDDSSEEGPHITIVVCSRKAGADYADPEDDHQGGADN